MNDVGMPEKMNHDQPRFLEVPLPLPFFKRR